MEILFPSLYVGITIVQLGPNVKIIPYATQIDNDPFGGLYTCLAN